MAPDPNPTNPTLTSDDACGHPLGPRPELVGNPHLVRVRVRVVRVRVRVRVKVE